MGRLQNLDPKDCKNEVNCLKLVTNKDEYRKLLNFQVFPDSSYQAELEQQQDHIQLQPQCSTV